MPNDLKIKLNDPQNASLKKSGVPDPGFELGSLISFSTMH